MSSTRYQFTSLEQEKRENRRCVRFSLPRSYWFYLPSLPFQTHTDTQKHIHANMKNSIRKTSLALQALGGDTLYVCKYVFNMRVSFSSVFLFFLQDTHINRHIHAFTLPLAWYQIPTQIYISPLIIKQPFLTVGSLPKLNLHYFSYLRIECIYDIGNSTPVLWLTSFS